MAKLTAKDWEQIEVRYKAGDKLRAIADEYDYSSGNIASKAKKEGWIHGELKQDIQDKTNSIKSIVDVDLKLKQKLKQEQIPALNAIIERELNIKQYAEDTQFAILDVMRKASKAADKFIEDHPDGWYLKSDTTKGRTFGLVTEVIPHLAPILNGATAITKNDAPNTQVNIQNNSADTTTVKWVGED